jgi:dUTP pyrophosphatase
MKTSPFRIAPPSSFSPVTVRIARVRPEAVLPRQMTAGAAGFDLTSVVELTLQPSRWAAVPTGLAVELPPGYEGQVRPRSGLAAKFGVGLLNAPGTIDSDYRGEVQVLLINHGAEPFLIRPGERIAQLVVAAVAHPVELVEVPELGETRRGAGGFGSTGR